MTPAFWVLYALACLLLLVGVPLSMRWERRQHERDRERWRSMGGGRL